MSAPKPLPSTAYLHQCFDYNPETGILTWKSRPLEHFKNRNGMLVHESRQVGKRAGSEEFSGNLKARLCGENYQVARIIWKMQTGQEPSRFIINKNGINGDNCWDNLTDITWSAVKKAERKEMILKNVDKHITKNRFTDRWTAKINGYSLGYFVHREQAVAAYQLAVMT